MPIKVTPIVTDLDARRCEVTVEAAVVGAESVTFTLDGQQTSVAVKDGNARAVSRWSMPACGTVLMTRISTP